MTGLDLRDEVPSLVEQYQLAGLRLIRLLPTTGRNVNAIMADAEGGQYVLRCYLGNVDFARIEFQLDFQAHLLGKGIPTAEVVATKAGERLVNAGRRTWVLFGRVAGAGYDYASEEQLRNAARCLADLHEAAEDLPGRTSPTTPFPARAGGGRMVPTTSPSCTRCSPVARWPPSHADTLDRPI